MYKAINSKIKKSLADIFGKEHLFTEKNDLEAYAKDETPGAYHLPEAAVRPTQQKQVDELLKLANSEKFPVIPRGGGTGLSGGALAVHGGVVVSFELMNRIIDIDRDNRMAVIEPGVINGILQQAAEKTGLFYPVNPASMDSCTLAGNVAEATGGANTVRFGTTRNYVTGMKAVSGAGTRWSAGGKIFKNSTDQALIQLMCGSEGTLGIFTELTFRLVSKPLYSTWIIAPFRHIYDIPDAALKIFRENINPTMVELMDSATLSVCSKHLGKDVQYKNYHQLLIRFDSNDRIQIMDECEKVGKILQVMKSVDTLVADTRVQQDRIWEIRSNIHESIVAEAGSVCEEDVVVPAAAVRTLIERAYAISDKFGYPVMMFGHLGDGNMHLNFTKKNKDGSDLEEIENMRAEVFLTAVSLGGKISGEHGIGISKKLYFNKHVDPGYISFLKKIKREFDPSNILNPGKIID
ncbi:MAG: FAD-binding oxidoreductase [Elusimicrobia bacterium]|nr:FAD-binding oxidoreductase [Elusimicrobiota bacterium]